MLAPDVVNLRQFYATPLGAQAAALIGQSLEGFWPDAKGDSLLGIGYPTPYIARYLDRATPTLVCMPAQQGAIYWPPTRANLAFLAQESELPLPENSMNRILLVHSVESSEQLTWMMQELWRVLTPGGRVLAIVPNRLSLWARSSKSPFGYGRPFTMAQLKTLMTDNQFTLTRSTSALFIPPVRLRLLWKFAEKIEMAGRVLCPFFGGVLLLEAEKQLYAAIKQPVRAANRKPVPATQPALSSGKL